MTKACHKEYGEEDDDKINKGQRKMSPVRVNVIAYLIKVSQVIGNDVGQKTFHVVLDVDRRQCVLADIYQTPKITIIILKIT